MLLLLILILRSLTERFMENKLNLIWILNFIVTILLITHIFLWITRYIIWFIRCRLHPILQGVLLLSSWLHLLLCHWHRGYRVFRAELHATRSFFDPRLDLVLLDHHRIHAVHYLLEQYLLPIHWTLQCLQFDISL